MVSAMVYVSVRFPILTLVSLRAKLRFMIMAVVIVTVIGMVKDITSYTWYG